MHMRVRRASLPAALAVVFLLLLGWLAVPARAVSVDPELIAESVTEDGYYVDSSASYLKSDADLDRLRSALEQAGRAGVVVLPAGVDTGPVMERLLQSPNHKATYAILVGTRLQANSSDLSRSTVSRLLTQAKKAGGPKAEVLSFLSLLNPQRRAKAATKQKASSSPSAEASAAPEPSAAASTTPVAAKQADSGGNNNMLYIIIGVVVVVVAAAGGGFILWRRSQSGPKPPAGPPAGPWGGPPPGPPAGPPAPGLG